MRVAGLVVVHQAPPTAKGFHFITLENSDGLIDLILRPAIYAQYRQVLRKALLLVVEEQAGVTNLLVERVASLPGCRWVIDHRAAGKGFSANSGVKKAAPNSMASGRLK